MNAHDKAEALRLLSELNESVGKYAAAIRNDKRNGMTGAAAAEVDKHVDAIRSLLSAQEAEPSAVGMLPDDLLRLIGAYGAAATYQSDVYRLHHYEQLILGIKSYVEQRARELARQGVGNG